MIRKILLYFIIVTGLLFALRELHYYGLLKQTKGYYAKYKTAFLSHNKYDVLFLGSSRVEMAYDTGLFDTLTGSNSFNLSQAGATPELAYRILKIYLQKSDKPSKVYYDIDFHILKKGASEIKEFNNFFPFLKDETVRKELNQIDPRMNHFYYDPFYSWPYTGLKNISTGLHGLLNIPNKTDHLYYKGFMRETTRPSLNYTPNKTFFGYIHLKQRSYLDSIIIICKKNNIQLSLLTSPMYGGGTIDLKNKKQLVSQLNNIASIHHLKYYDLSALSFCSDRRLFIDQYHLNYMGAREFTRYLANLKFLQ